MKEWQKPKQLLQQSGNVPEKPEMMTDEQLECLRMQIAAYYTISEQLVEMYNTHSSHQDPAGLLRVENTYCDLLMRPTLHKKQRWTPTTVQRQILEGIFDKVNKTPSIRKIKELTAELSQYGQISVENVYNWFMNRRARSKRKQKNVTPSSTESQVESSKVKKTKPEEFKSQHKPNTCSDLPFWNPQSNEPDCVCSHQLAVYPQEILVTCLFLMGCYQNQGVRILLEKCKYNFYRQAGDYDMTGWQ